MSSKISRFCVLLYWILFLSLGALKGFGLLPNNFAHYLNLFIVFSILLFLPVFGYWVLKKLLGDILKFTKNPNKPQTIKRFFSTFWQELDVVGKIVFVIGPIASLFILGSAYLYWINL